MSRSVWLWRWRRNPLRRRSYAVEAWTLLAAGLVAVVAATVAGIAAAGAEQHRLAQQRSQRYPTVAVLTQDAPEGSGYSYGVRASVRWTARDGSRHDGIAKVDAGLREGARTTVWTDGRGGRLVPAPPSRADAWLESAAAGVAAAGGLCVAVLACWQVAVRVGDRRRAELWGIEWAEVGPRWDRRNA